MRKIPTVFRRDPEDMRRVLPEVHPDCQWVLDGEGVPTRKYDGTCVMFDGQRWWARREVKPGKQAPHAFVALETDEVTGKTVGWELAEQSAFRAPLLEAVQYPGGYREGTYELCGPKINRNPEACDEHTLIPHRAAERFDAPRDFEGLREWLLAHPHYEGIVWHHPDGRMAKLKRRDFAARTQETTP